MDWNHTSETPPTNTLLLVRCPDWCVEGYQVCEWDGTQFCYSDQPNDNFTHMVFRWAIIPR